MTDFIRSNKVNGVYWLKNPIETLIIKIKTKPQDGIIQLPRFDQYNRPDTSNNSKEDNIDEVCVKWQEKIFSRHEIDKYSNVHNCITDTELEYFELLENTQHKSSKIFTYINKDYYRPMPIVDNKKEKQYDIPFLNSCFQKLNLKTEDTVGKVFNDGSSSTTHLFRSNEDVSLDTEQWTAMHIVYDSSEYNKDSQLLVKQESTLVSLYYNATKNFVILSPDTNDLTFNPYTMDGDRNGPLYAVEISRGEERNDEELVKLLNKLYKRWEKKQKQLMKFCTPPLGKRTFHVVFEIVSAENFETDNIYIEFHIKIPDEIECKGTLKGKTHTTSALDTAAGRLWLYGNTIDLDMEITTGIAPSPLKLYLEVISTDWWGRHRTEGYSAFPLPLRPGHHARTLACRRPEEPNRVRAETRRFFIGGCNLIKDLDVVDNPAQVPNCCWRSTGSVRVRWDTLGQGAARAAGGGGGAEAALRRYRRAVAALTAARGLRPSGPDSAQNFSSN